MIDPKNITNFSLDDLQLEEHLLFWICAAGKNGTTAARCLDKLMYKIGGYFSGPFQSIRDKVQLDASLVLRMTADFNKDHPVFPELLKDCGIGCYNAKSRSMHEAAHKGLDLRTCGTDDLEAIYGIGMKTSRCFILHSRDDARVAGLDTHILKHLREKGVDNVPKSTPSSKKEYKRLEKEMLRFADAKGMHPAEYDLYVWRKYAVKSTPLT